MTPLLERVAIEGTQGSKCWILKYNREFWIVVIHCLTVINDDYSVRVEDAQAHILVVDVKINQCRRSSNMI